MTHVNKFYLILAVAALAAGAMLYTQIRRAVKIDTKPAALPLIEQNFTEIRLTAADKPLGNPGAQLLIIGFFDFNEPVDRAQADIIAEFVKNNSNAAQFYIKHDPKQKIFGADDQTLANRAFLCAAAQKKSGEFLSALNELKKITAETLAQTAAALALNTDAWQICLSDPAAADAIAADMALAQNIGVKNTPAIFVNNKKINLDQDTNLKDLLNQLIDV